MAKKTKKTAKIMRTFQSETLSFDSLKIIAAPNPQDDLSPEELMRFAQDNSHSPELIQQLIEFIRHI